MLSKKTRYAIIALGKLSGSYGSGPVQISSIAESEYIPKRFLEGILLELKRFGILGSKSGKNGGYYLIKDPSLVRLLDIVNYLEGSIALLPCTSGTHYQSCEFHKNESTCKVKHIFADVKNSIDNILGSKTLLDIM